VEWWALLLLLSCVITVPDGCEPVPSEQLARLEEMTQELSSGNI
jgi:hypothetical protein